MKSISIARIVVSFIFVVASIQLQGQGFDPSSAIDLPTSVGHGSDLEHVDLMSGALVIKIPLLHLKGRGVDTDVVATYTSKLWSSNYYVDPYNGWILTEEFGQGSRLGNGWSIGVPQLLAAVTGGVVCDGDCSGYMTTLEQLHRYDGSTISIGQLLGYGQTNGPLFSYDGTYVKSTDGFTMMQKDGSRFGIGPIPALSNTWGYVYEDTNGNQIGCTSTTCVDSVGRTFTFGTGTYFPSTFNYTDSNGSARTITFGYTNIGAEYPWVGDNTLCGVPDPAFNCVWNQGGFGNTLTSITLPNGTTYHFEYVMNGDGTTTGEIAKITLPTGGYIRYDYSSSATPGREVYEASDRFVAHRYVSSDGNPSSEQAWTYGLGSSGWPQVVDPIGNVHSETFSAGLAGPDAFNGQAFPPIMPIPNPLTAKDTAPNGSLLQQIDRVWTNDTSEYAVNSAPYGSLPNPELTQVTTTLGGSSQQSIKTFSYARFGNVSEEDDYDWAPSGTYGNLLRATTYSYLPDTNPSYAADSVHILDRVTSEIAIGCNYAGSGTCSQKYYTYDGYNSGRLAAGLSGTTSVIQHDYGQFSTSNILRGNVTQETRGIGSESTTIDHSYNDLGDLLATMDGKGYTTTFDYTDNYYGQQPSNSTLAFVTKVTKPTTGGVQHIERSQYYLNSGLTAAHCGENFPSSSCVAQLSGSNADYAWLGYDGLNRATSVHMGDGGSASLAYNDVALSTNIIQTRAISSSVSTVKRADYDGLGRQTRSELTSDPQGTVYIDTAYDSAGRTISVSNPYRTTSDSTYGFTTFAYDGIGRKIMQCQPDNGNGSGQCVAGQSYQSWSFTGNSVTSTDEAGMSWKRTSDALGRLRQVLEPNGYTSSPSLETDYFYDSLGNLWCVEQHGGVTGTGCASASSQDSTSPWRVRRFTYDSLSRLLSAKNPETGTISYTYDANSNVLTKTDARGVQIAYGHDQLNRVTGKSYNNGDSSVGYTYDASGVGMYGIGRRVGMTDASGSTGWTYDVIGRTASESRTIAGTTNFTKTISTTYNYDGSPWRITYPSGAVVEYLPNGTGRSVSVNDITNGVQYAQSAQYAPEGDLTSLLMGYTSTFQGITLSNQFNKRLQPAVFAASVPAGTLMSLGYDFHLGSHDNGNLYYISNNKDSTRNQTFYYDSLNRLLQATGGSAWGIRFTNSGNGALGIDAWGNLIQTSQVSGTSMFPMSVNQQTDNFNRFMLNGYSYDAAGNVLNDGSGVSACSGHAYSWNAEELMSCGYGTNYTYNGDGERVKKSSGTLYWGGEAGSALAESDQSGNLKSEYIFFNGKRIARRDMPSTIDVRFTNDSCSGCGGTPVGGGDRNLWVTSVVIGGTTIPVTDSSVSWTNAPCNRLIGSALILACVGDIYVSTTLQSPNIQVNAWGDPDLYIYPDMQVYVNGALEGEWNVTGSSQNYAVNSVHYYLSDHLGSSNVVVNSRGGIENESDYYPFGGERVVTQALSNQHYKFTGKERDTETGNDYFGARYYTSITGRFLSPDWSAKEDPIPYAKVDNPQSLNLYAYVLNNPLARFDPDGHQLMVSADLQKTVDVLRQQSTSFNGELSHYEGAGAPNLIIQFGATANDPSGLPTSGVTNAPLNFNLTVSSDPHSDGIQYSLDTKSPTIITINNNIQGDAGQVESTTAHEVGHVHDARTNTNQYGHDWQKTKETQGKTPHDSRPEERRANDFKRQVERERRQYNKDHRNNRNIVPGPGGGGTGNPAPLRGDQ